MGIKKDNVTNTWIAFYSKRHPETRVPYRMQRKGIKSEAEARRVYNELVFEVEERLRHKTIPTWWECVEQYLEYARQKGHHEKTLHNYFIGLQAYTKPLWGTRLIDTITTPEIVNLIKVEFRSKSNTTKQSILKFVKAVFEYALEMNLVNRNPTPRLKLEAKERVKKGLSESQVKLLLEKAKATGCEWYPIWACAIYTGMRNSELYSLTWDKVDLGKRTITVDTAWNKYDGFKSTKSGHERIVEIALPLLTVLQELKIAEPHSHFILPRLVGWGKKGDQARELRLFLAGLGLPQMRFHDLRATTCSLLLSKGVPIYKIMAMLGWKDLKTASIYLRMTGDTVKGITNDLNLHNPDVQAYAENIVVFPRKP